MQSQRNSAGMGTDAAAAAALDLLRQGDFEQAWHRLQPVVGGPVDSRTASVARIVAAVCSVQADREGLPYPVVPEHLGDPEPTDAEILLEPAQALLQARKYEQGEILAEVADMLLPGEPEVQRLRRWALQRQPPGDVQPDRAPIIDPDPVPAPDEEVEFDLDLDPGHGDSDARHGREEEVEWNQQTASRRRVWRRLAVAIGVLLPLVLIAAFVPYPLKATEPFRIRPSDHREVRSVVTGVVQEISVEEGDRVEAGQLLATLDVRELRTESATLQADLERARAELEELEAGARPEEVEGARQRVLRLGVEVKFARKELKRTRSLAAQNVIAAGDLDTAKMEYTIARRELAMARAELALLEAGSRPEQIRAKQAEVERFEQEIELLERQIADSRIRSPIDGWVTTPRTHELLGKRVEPGDALLEVARLQNLEAEIMVSQKEMDAVEVGQEVVYKIEAFPSLRYHGEVLSISPVAVDGELARGKVVLVRASIDDGDEQLRGDMTGWCEIIDEPRSVLDLVTRWTSRWIRTRLVL